MKKKLKLIWLIIIGKYNADIITLSKIQERLHNLLGEYHPIEDNYSVVRLKSTSHEKISDDRYSLYVNKPEPTIMEGNNLEELFIKMDDFLSGKEKGDKTDIIV